MFFLNETATTEIYTYFHTLSLHDALPISQPAPVPPRRTAGARQRVRDDRAQGAGQRVRRGVAGVAGRSEEHTSELQSLMRIPYAAFWLKKKNKTIQIHINAIRMAKSVDRHN